MVQEDSSFITFASILHPESASSTIDPRFQNQQNPWRTVYNETLGGSEISYENIPVAVSVVAVDDDADEGDIEANPQQPNDLRVSSRNDSSDSQNQNTQGQTTAQPTRPQPWRHSNLIDLILGFALAITCFVWTAKIEFFALIIYALASGFNHLAEEVFSTTPGLFFKSICLLLVSIFVIVDSCLLLVSIFVTEIIGGIALMLCTLFGGARSGKEWHQFIRKTCHMIRWAFRDCLKTWPLERVNVLQLYPVENADPVPEVTEDPSCPATYTDDIPPEVELQLQPTSPVSSPSTLQWSDEATLPSTVAFPNETITIAPEDVQVVDEEQHSRTDDELAKSIQHVEMS